METIRSIFLGTAALSVIAVLSLVIGMVRGTASSDSVVVVRSVSFGGMLLHLVHSAEEALTGFYHSFPMLLGLSPWPLSFFIGFNAAWLVIWFVSARMIGEYKLAMAAIWFLAIASVINGLFHPALALNIGEYFPGLYSSPFVGVLGVILVIKLLSATNKNVTV